MSSLLQNNIANLQNIIDMVNILPDASGVELPTLTNEGTSSDLLSGKQLIDSNGNIVTGTHVCQSSGVEVQKKSGTFRVDSNGKATVNCGFRPDFVMFHANEADSDDCNYTSAVSFLEDTRYEDSGLQIALGSNNGTYVLYPYDNSDGFGVTISLVTENYQWTNPSTSTTFRYAAVKYT